MKRNYEIMKNPNGYLTPEQMHAIIEATNNIKERLIITLLATTGKRIDEVLTIKVKRINFNEKTITFRVLKKHPVTKKWLSKKLNKDVSKITRRDYLKAKVDKKPYLQTLPVTDKVLTMCRDVINENKLESDDYLFKSYSVHGHYTRQAAFYLVRRLSSKAGVKFVGGERTRPHHFRHGVGMYMVSKMKTAADLYKIMEWMAHDNLEITMGYTRAAGLNVRDQFRIIDQLEF